MVTHTNTTATTTAKMTASSARLLGPEQLNRAVGTFALAKRCVR